MKQAIQVLSLLLLSALFFFQAYQIITEPEKSADKYFKQYADFRIWSNKAQRKMLSGSTLLEFPGTEGVKPYKVKITYIIAYINLLGALGMIVGETSMIIPLAIIHLLQSFLKNNPFPLHPVADQASYDNKMRSFLIDMVILMALCVVGFAKHPLAGNASKSSKVQKPKTE